MPTHAQGRNGSVVGLFGRATTATFHANIVQFRLRVNRQMTNVGGFGDGGNSYFEEGVNDAAGAANGFLLTTGTIGIAAFSGTATGSGTAAFKADNAVTYSGSVKMQNIQVDSSYQGGTPTVNFQFVFNGPMTETVA